MLFIISKTSDYMDDAPAPCVGAKKMVIHSDFDIFEKNLEYKETKTDAVQQWVVEINSLEELIALQKKSGFSLILSAYNSRETIHELEIYNDYRE